MSRRHPAIFMVSITAFVITAILQGCGGGDSAEQATTSAPALLTIATTALSPAINVDVSEADTAVAHQVTYRCGVMEGFDLNRTPAAIVGNVTSDVQSSGINFLNATLDSNFPQDAGLFTYQLPDLTFSTSANAPLVQTFNTLSNDISSSSLQTLVEISGLSVNVNEFLLISLQ